MTELERELYTLFLEKLIEDLIMEIEVNEIKTRLSKRIDEEKEHERRPWVQPWTTPYKEYTLANSCSKCGLKLDQTMGYCCPDAKCPCGLGPVMCGVLTTS